MNTTRTPLLAAAGIALAADALSACAAPATAPTPVQPPAASASPAPAGALPKASGEAGALVDKTTGAETFTIQVNEIETATECEARSAGFTLAPERGTFLILDVTATLAAGANPAGTEEAFMPLAAEAFSVVPQSGSTEDDVTSASAWGCLTETDLAPAVVNPGETVTGKIVLDTRVTSGTVIYDPDGSGGWSWPFGG